MIFRVTRPSHCSYGHTSDVKKVQISCPLNNFRTVMKVLKLLCTIDHNYSYQKRSRLHVEVHMDDFYDFK